MVYDLIRDSFFGQAVRLATGKRVFLYPEEKDLSIWEQSLDRVKSGQMARTGTLQPTPEEQDLEEKDEAADSGASTPTRRALEEKPEDDNALVNVPSGVRVDPENGRDVHIISWYGDNDPEVRYPPMKNGLELIL